MNMIGLWSAHSSSYILVLTAITFFAFSLPIFLRPGMWAKLLLWRIPDDTDLAWYFARCLGAFAIVTNLFFLRAGIYGTGATTMLEFFAVFCVFMVVVHIWGWAEGTQPMTETLEIGFWAGLFVLTLLFMPMR
ncbi:hypothetical protein [Puniceibacterium sp. IMCC21224]|uniref:hypothetical protein n=1 Tax=Puniceibacterium sp. IMCC21224 TaxID=1618204 RepID=UPI00065D56E5|nr:hypothetical protein [Puniceibacterium sp. IMCC21224]KMK66722.1 hypothetical protein IMCC21224_111579 [Puniceibacterium sp. IMCC21224]